MIYYQRILVPLDGSELAELALAPALVIAEALAARIVCLQVITGSTLDSDLRLGKRVIAARKEAAALYFESLKDRYSQTKTPIEVVIAVGSAAKVITDFASEHAIDLIVLSSHGHTGLARWVYGNVTAKIMNRAPCDTLMVRAHSPARGLFSTNRILVPLDGSRLAEQALRPAISLASVLEMEILLLRVSPPLDSELQPISGGYLRSLVDEFEARSRDDALIYLHGVSASLEQHDIPINVEAVTGPAAATIVDYAKKHLIDLIVMSSHGHSGTGLWLMGGVSEKVLRKATCATLAVRPSEQPRNDAKDNDG